MRRHLRRAACALQLDAWHRLGCPSVIRVVSRLAKKGMLASTVFSLDVILMAIWSVASVVVVVSLLTGSFMTGFALPVHASELQDAYIRAFIGSEPPTSA